MGEMTWNTRRKINVVRAGECNLSQALDPARLANSRNGLSRAGWFLLPLSVLFVFSVLPLSGIAQEQAKKSSVDGPDSTSVESSTGEGDSKQIILHIDHLLAGKYGPVGIFYQINPQFRWYFFPKTDNIILKEAHFAAGPTVAITPAFVYYGPSLTIAPLTILSIRAEFTHYIFGLAGKRLGLLDYNPPRGQYSNYDYGFRNEHGAEMGHVTADAWAFFLKPTLKLQLGPIVLVHLGNFMFLHPTNFKGMFYGDIPDLILTHNSWCLINDTILLYEIAKTAEQGWGLYAGLVNHMTFVIDDHSTPGFEDTYRWKVGPMLAWTIADKWGDYWVEKPSVVFQAHYVIKDPIDDDHKRVVTGLLVFAFSTNWQIK